MAGPGGARPHSVAAPPAGGAGETGLVAGVVQPATEADEGGGGIGSLEDTTAAFAVPSAEWGEGVLQASFAFGGTGGHIAAVKDGQVVNTDTFTRMTILPTSKE